MTTIVVRHMRSKGNENHHEYRRTPDPRIGITHSGIEQSIQLAEYLNELIPQINDQKKPIIIYSSPFDRAAHTARICIENAPALKFSNLIYDDRLVERNMGKFSGYNKEEAEKDFFEENRLYEEEKAKTHGAYYARPPEGESVHDVHCRLESFVSQELSPDCINLVFTHGVPWRLIALHLLKQNAKEAFGKMENPDNTAAYMIEFKDNAYCDKGLIYTPQPLQSRSRIIHNAYGPLPYTPSQLIA